MAAVSSPLQPPALKSQEHDPYSPHTRDTITPEFDDEKTDRETLPSFSIHNVLKKERDNSPDHVFSTEKLLENTPVFESLENSRTSMSPRLEDDEGSSFRAEISVDENSCCSDDTVLSVGNENPLTIDDNQMKSHANPGLTSFKHIQTHLNAITQLSQNLTMTQPLLLRPNPITPNPLMFLNQPLIFQSPLINQDIIKPTLPNRPTLPQQPFMNFGLRKDNEILERRDDRRIYTPEESRDFINQNCLKFSIDNILKADFGRRITDPLQKRRGSKSREVRSPVKERGEEVEGRAERGAIDLSKGDDTSSNSGSTPGTTSGDGSMVWPAWVYCTRYSDRPSSGPRTRRPKKPSGEGPQNDEKRPRTAFSGPQLARLKHEFAENRYLTERRRQALAAELGLAEAQIKIWFQNKRAKIKKASGQRNPLALQLMAQGLYNHSTVPLTREEEELEMKAREREKELQSRQ